MVASGTPSSGLEASATWWREVHGIMGAHAHAHGCTCVGSSNGVGVGGASGWRVEGEEGVGGKAGWAGRHRVEARRRR